jgi:hypothetical protein
MKSHGRSLPHSARSFRYRVALIGVAAVWRMRKEGIVLTMADRSRIVSFLFSLIYPAGTPTASKWEADRGRDEIRRRFSAQSLKLCLP